MYGQNFHYSVIATSKRFVSPCSSTFDAFGFHSIAIDQGESTRSHNQEAPATLTIGSKTYQGNSAIAEYLTDKMNPSLLGSEPTQKALIHQTMLQSPKLFQDLETQGPETWSRLNSEFENKTFAIGNSYSLADISMYATLYFHFVTRFLLLII